MNQHFKMEMTFTLETIHDTARVFLVKFKGLKVFAFHGEMGAGKTTFIHAICDVLKVKGPVASPTFSIINDYKCNGTHLYHIDLYRLRDEGEAIRAGVEDCLYSGAVCLVEWPTKALSIFPEDTVHVYIEMLDPQTRLIWDNDK